ncbi:hypothetical protein M2138_000059 [Dysgonomonadaceae bacterium PH5-43]|nr:hypothetical protein [Dysgonomonadaceae bacterium PH5-43]
MAMRLFCSVRMRIYMVKIIKFLTVFLFPLLLCGCDGDLEITAADYEPKVVVEGWIENDAYAQVLLTLSASFEQQLDTAVLYKNIIKSARVSVSDGVETEVLALEANYNYLPPYVYYGSRIKGEVGKTYSLTVEYKNRIITASTYIPQPVRVDSCWFVKELPSDTTGYVHIRFTNVADAYYQVSTMVVGSENIFTPCLYGNYVSTQFSGGSVELQLNKGITIIPETVYNTYFPVNKTVMVRLRTQPKEAYDFWTSWQNELINAQNPIFPAYTSLKSNVNGGIGIWSGYYSTFISASPR